jgi:hypothetical protein
LPGFGGGRIVSSADMTDAMKKHAKEAVRKAKAKHGAGWDYLSADQRSGAVALNIMSLLIGQDEEHASPGVRRLQLIAEKAMEILEGKD